MKKKYFTEEEKKAARRERYHRTKNKYKGSVKDDFSITDEYSFRADDDWGFYRNGVYKTGNKANNGYIHIWFRCTDGKYRNCTEHKMKWIYFNGDVPEGYEIDHIIPLRNGGTNKLSNLRMVTPEGNMNNEYTKKRHSETHKAKEILQFDLEGNLVREWSSAKECEENGFCSRWVYDACNGRNWKSGHKYKGFNWYYK